MEAAEVDTIAAIATPPGKGAIGIVRLSGSRAFAIAELIMGRKNSNTYGSQEKRGRADNQQINLIEGNKEQFVNREHKDNQSSKTRLIVSSFYNSQGELLDKGIVLLFYSPASFTGDNLVEFHTHGNPIVLQSILDSIIHLGARQAEAGEFSRRAYMNGKMDLAQAEAVADLINSRTKAAAFAAVKSLQGDFSVHIKNINELLIQLRVYIEAALDFPEEEVDFLQDKEIQKRSSDIIEKLQRLITQSQQGVLLNEQKNIAIFGQPNAGKSSLLNFLCFNERAIVSPIAGTTRDFVQETVSINDMTVLLTDTAGVRDNANELEEEGIKRAWQQAKLSDIIILIYDISLVAGGYGGYNRLTDETNSLIKQLENASMLHKTILVANKIDLCQRSTRQESNTADQLKLDDGTQIPYVQISAKTGRGIESLKDIIARLCGKDEKAPIFSARRRHLMSLEKALGYIREGCVRLKEEEAGELLAEDLKQAQNALGDILGETSSEELLDRIFADFCIGK